MEDWIRRLIQERADLEVKCLSLKRYLKDNSASVVNEGDRMYSVMEEQLEAMMLYRNLLTKRIGLIWQR